MEDLNDELLTAAQAAKLLGISAWQLYAHVRAGILPPGVVVRLGRSVRVSRSRLKDWVRAGGQGLSAADKLNAAAEMLTHAAAKTFAGGK